MMEQRNVSSQVLNRKIGSKESLYRTLTNVYFLPALSSHAITKSFLLKVLDLSNTNILRVKNSQIRLRGTIYKRIPKDEIHHIVNSEVISKGLQLGFDEGMLADYNWYAQIYLKLFPEDPHFLGRQPPEEEQNSQLSVDREVRSFKFLGNLNIFVEFFFKMPLLRVNFIIFFEFMRHPKQIESELLKLNTLRKNSCLFARSSEEVLREKVTSIESHILNLDRKRQFLIQKNTKIMEKRDKLVAKREDLILEAQGVNVRTMKTQEQEKNKNLMME
jgi:hypothetical protein